MAKKVKDVEEVVEVVEVVEEVAETPEEAPLPPQEECLCAKYGIEGYEVPAIADVAKQMVSDFETIHQELNRTRQVRGQAQVEAAVAFVQGLAAAGRYS